MAKRLPCCARLNEFDFLKRHCCIGKDQKEKKLLLDIEKLSFKRMLDSEYPICECERVHPNKGFGFCTSCREDLGNRTISIDELHKHSKHGYVDFLEASYYRLTQRFDEAENQVLE